MKFRIIFVISFLFFNILGSAQQIHWANPKPTGSIINDIEFWDDEHGLMVGSWGAVLTTSDGGANWDVTPSFTRESLSTIYILSEENAIVASWGSLFKTINYGKTWSLLFDMPNSIKIDPKSIDMIDDIHGYACSEQKIFRTNDGGKNWSNKGITMPKLWDDEFVVDIAFKNIDSGLFITWDSYLMDGHVFSTTNACSSFEKENLNYYSEDFIPTTIQYINNSTYLQTIAFASLSKKNVSIPFNMENVLHPNNIQGRDYWGPGVIRSEDNGKKWDIILDHNHGVWFSPRRLKIANDSVFYYFGACSGDCGGFEYLATSNGGQSWAVQRMPDYPYFYSPSMTALYPFSAEKAIGFFSGGLINLVKYNRYYFVQTIDGKNWSPVYQDYLNAFHGVFFMDNSMFLLVNHRLLKSRDYFESRDSIPFPGKELQLAAKYGQQAAVYAQNDSLSFLINTMDNGQQWQQTQLNIHHFFIKDMEYAASDQLFLLGKENEGAKLFVNQPLQAELTEFQLPAAFSELNDIYIHSGEKTLFGADEAGQGSYYVFNEEEDGWEAYSLNLAPLRMGFASGANSIYLVDKAKYPGIWESIRVPYFDPLPVFTAPDSGYIADLVMRDDGRLVALFNQSRKNYYGRYHYSWFCEQLNDESWEMHGPYPLLDGLTLDPDGHHVWAFGSDQSDSGFGEAYGENRLLYLGDGLPVGIEPIPTDDKQEAFTVEGNPFSKSLQISIKLEYQGESTLQLTDMNGKIVCQSKIMLHGRASRFLIQTHDLAPGAYVCTLTAGEEKYSETVIKK